MLGSTIVAPDEYETIELSNSITSKASEEIDLGAAGATAAAALETRVTDGEEVIPNSTVHRYSTPTESINTHSYGYSNSNSRSEQDPNQLSYSTMVMACLFCAGGSSLFIAGPIIFFHSDEPRGLDMFILGGIMLLPGFYGFYLLSRRVYQLLSASWRRSKYRSSHSRSHHQYIHRNNQNNHNNNSNSSSNIADSGRPGARLLSNVEV